MVNRRAQLAASSILTLGWMLVGRQTAKADSIFAGNLETQNVTIKEVKGDSLVYEISGRVSEKPVDRITRVIATNETPLNAAETDFAAQKWNQAVDGYQRAIRTSTKQWVKDWAALRLVSAASQSGRFDAAAAAYILTLLKNPTGPTSRPAMPEAKSTFLDSAVADVNTTLSDPKLTIDQKRALIGFLIDLQQARQDTAGEDAAFAQLARLPGSDANDPGVRRMQARRKLQSAQRALDAKSYAQAMSEIDSNRIMFVETSQQADALYIIAQARLGQAGSDANNLKDAALAFMRVVALAKDEPGSPHVVDSLQKTAGILEQINDRESAVKLYQQIAAQYPDQPAAAAARSSIQRLKQN